MKFDEGDRVRVIQANGPYTGCRGTIASSPAGGGGAVSPLGCYVAIDGENGVVRPFLHSELEALSIARVRSAVQRQEASAER